MVGTGVIVRVRKTVCVSRKKYLERLKLSLAPKKTVKIESQKKGSK